MPKENKWLPHLEKSVPLSVSADKLSMYTIALEGFRRGLDLYFYTTKYGNKVEINYAFIYQGKEYKFAVSKGNQVTREAMKISRDKGLTKKYLEKSNVAVPVGKTFEKEATNEEIIQYAENIGFPVVLKPTNANLGQGVIPNITSKEELSESLMKVRKGLGFKEVIIEQHFEGEEFRVYVIGGQVIGAINRIPANITGDGKHSIRELIAKKNEERKKNPNLRSRPIKIDAEVKKYIERAGYTLDSILKEDERLFLRKNSNVSSGGDPIDVTDQLTPKIKEIAIGASKAIPGLVQCGVDIIVNKEKDTGAVIEVNTRPGIGSHLYPMEGLARDIPKAIIDYYFPNTKRKNHYQLFYYDYKSIVNLLNSGAANKVKVPAFPEGDIRFRKYLIKGKVQRVGYRRWVQRNALHHHLHGYARNNSTGSVTIVCAGEKENLERFGQLLRTSAPEKAEITEIKEYEWDKPVKVGFEIRGPLKKKVVKKKKQTTTRKSISTEQTKPQSKKKPTFLNSRYLKPAKKVYKYVKKIVR